MYVCDRQFLVCLMMIFFSSSRNCFYKNVFPNLEHDRALPDTNTKQWNFALVTEVSTQLRRTTRRRKHVFLISSPRLKLYISKHCKSAHFIYVFSVYIKYVCFPVLSNSHVASWASKQTGCISCVYVNTGICNRCPDFPAGATMRA